MLNPYDRSISRMLFLVVGAASFCPLLVAQQDEDQLPGPTSDYSVVSPDGSKMVFVSNATGTRSVWLANTDGSNARPVRPWSGAIQKDPSWSPDGQKIVFSSNRGGSGFNIWTITPSGLGETQLTVNVKDNDQPRYSPDGLKIAFVSNRTGKRELWTMTSAGAGQKAVGLQSLRISDPTWSPDGTRLAYVGCTPVVLSGTTLVADATCNILSITLDASSTTRVTSGNVHDWNPDWGTAGIIFASNRNNAQGLWIVNPDGTNLRPFTSPSTTGDLHPRWEGLSGSVTFTRAAIGNDRAEANIWRSGFGGVGQQVTAIRGFTTSGDVNVDGEVNCVDVGLVRAAFGKRTGQAGFDARADVNSDGVVDVRDLALVSRGLPAGSVCP